MNEPMIRSGEGLAFFQRGRTDVELRPVQLRRALICADGFRLSVQAHAGAWADPRDDTGPWIKVEVATLTLIGGWRRYLDHRVANPTGAGWCCFYAYVPLSAVEQLIEAHGGLAGERG